MIAGCTEAASPPAPAILPAVATATASVDPWGPRLVALRGTPTSGGEAVPLASMAGPGAPTVYAFWATYCPPCLAEMEMFQAMHEAGRRVIGVSLDAGEAKAALAALEARGVTYPNLVLDTPSMKAAGRALPSGLPFTLVLDANRTPRVALFGKAEPAEVEAALKAAAR